jgi:hypothetical protein
MAIIGVSSRVHFFARPAAQERLTAILTAFFGCAVVPLPMPSMLAYRFPDGSSVSVEFTPNALDEAQARWGAWIEVTTDDLASVRQAALEASLPTLSYGGDEHFYIQSPGGQVWGIREVSGSLSGQE